MATIQRLWRMAGNPDSHRPINPLPPPHGCPVAGWAGRDPNPRVRLGTNNPLD